MLIKIRHAHTRNEPCAVGGRRYMIDDQGIACVTPEHWEVLQLSGLWTELGFVDEQSAETVRLPQTRAEVFAAIKAMGLRGADLREMADELDSGLRQAATEVAPPEAPAELIEIPVPQEAPIAELPSEAPVIEEQVLTPPPVVEEQEQEIVIDPSMSKKDLIGVARRMGLNINTLARKDEIYKKIAACAEMEH